MPPSSAITPEEERVYIEMLRQMTPVQRLQRVNYLLSATRSLYRVILRQKYPDASEEEINMLILEYDYGKDLADRVRVELARRRQAAEVSSDE